MACGSCGGGNRARTKFEVTLRKTGKVVTVDDLPSARRLVANTEGGGTYRAVQSKA